MSSGPVQRRGKEQVVTNIVTAVAEAEGIDQVELTPPLYEVIDIDALETFIGSADATASFHYRQWEVTVQGDGTVELEKPPDDE